MFYLDTSVIDALFDKEIQKRIEITRALLDSITEANILTLYLILCLKK
jgi:hypothetical protein